jgi:heme exporter protein B
VTGALWALFRRELRLGIRVGGGATMGVVFFLAVVTVIPFGVGPDLPLLSRIGPAVLWLGALLATLLGLDRLFQADQEDGSLDLFHHSGIPLEMAVLTKALAHWTATGLPLVVATPVLAIFVNLSLGATAAVTLTLLAGTPALTFLGAIGAALTVALRRGGLLLSILILPLAVPVLIFGVSAANAAVTPTSSFLPPFLILCALTLFSGVLGTVASAWALRAALD